MAKIIKLSVSCPKCGTKLAVAITEQDLGTKKQCACQKCAKKFNVNVPATLAYKFETDPTNIGGGLSDDISLLLEVLPNDKTEYQTFELTSDYYTIGRSNNSGPEHRPDVAVVTNDMKMSRKHAVIKKKGKIGFTLNDLGSKNGVTLNGHKLEPDEEVYISDGDTIVIGDTQFRVSYAEKSKEDDLTK